MGQIGSCLILALAIHPSILALNLCIDEIPIPDY
ncbi:photosystem I reaction center subunit XII [Spirosoma aureum]|uniref:Photosystem I reaction center subunit XII n=1 Tax=Spirosoma aureum TaxID=2692134 RepID=A0A6G9AZN5_9BACT|nr:photosystem I reaction center subunit XII [Spirosoma aureum]